MSRVSKVHHPDDDLPWDEQTSMMMPSNLEANELSCWTTQPRQTGKTARQKLNKAVKIAVAMEAAEDAQTMLLAQAVHKGLEPWEQCPDVWETKAQFFQWMRGQMRKAWSRHPVKVSYMHAHRERVPLGRVTEKNPQGLVWGCRCEHCKQLFKQVECEVDHIDAAGSFKGWEDFEAWMVKLMHINWNSIRIVCKPCHRIKSYAETHKLTFEQAAIAKEAIAFSKYPVPRQVAMLVKLGHKPTDSSISNAKKRRAVYHQHLQEKL